MDEQVEELQALSANVLSDVERLRVLEEEKRSVAPGSAGFRAITDEVRRLAERIRTVTTVEDALARQLAGQDGLPTIQEADDQSVR